MVEMDDPYPRTWFQMYDEERQKREDLETVYSELGIAFDDLKRERGCQFIEIIKLMNDFPCWDIIDNEGLCIDPDECADCEQKGGYGSPCWVGKMKRILMGNNNE